MTSPASMVISLARAVQSRLAGVVLASALHLESPAQPSPAPATRPKCRTLFHLGLQPRYPRSALIE